ncbi:SAM-dependent methyltransferase SMT-type [Sesbania bispinosa]|nr:SAM-dependent methyltransferase SMT-type [Sesbania bispinosa]
MALPKKLSSPAAFTGSSAFSVQPNKKANAPPIYPVAPFPPRKVQDNYKQYWSFFRRPKEIETAEKVPDFVDTFYNLVTDIYEWGWGQSFHFSPSIPGKSHRDATRLHEEMAVDLIEVKPGDKILDVGCGVGGPMRAIAAHSRANVVGITINEYQVNRAKLHNKKAGLDSLCDVVCGNFLQMPFPDESFDGAYSIEGHVSRAEAGGGENAEHVEIIQGIERGDALPGLRSYADIAETAKKVGFEVVKERDLAKPPAQPWWSRLKMEGSLTGGTTSWSLFLRLWE